MRLAGTISRYSKRAMPQLASAAIHQGLADSSFRCAYHAKVMKTFDRASRPADAATGESCINQSFLLFAKRRQPGTRLLFLFQELKWKNQARARAEARKPARACADAARSGRDARSFLRRTGAGRDRASWAHWDTAARGGGVARCPAGLPAARRVQAACRAPRRR